MNIFSRCNALGCALGTVADTALGAHIPTQNAGPSRCHCDSTFPLGGSRLRVQERGSLPMTWQSWMEFPIPEFVLNVNIKEINQQMEDFLSFTCSLSFCFICAFVFLSLSLNSTIQITQISGYIFKILTLDRNNQFVGLALCNNTRVNTSPIDVFFFLDFCLLSSLSKNI